MNGIETIIGMNNKELLEHINNHPLVLLNEIESDLKMSPDYSGIDMKTLEKVTGKKVVDTFFVDSSGFGDESEPAMPFSSLVNEVRKIIKENEGSYYSCLTGIGQFQVYVTILKKEL